MKHKKHSCIKKSHKIILLIVVLVGLVSLDFYLGSDGIMNGTFRPESEFDAVTSATVTVAVVPSDYDSLANPVSRNTDPSYAQIEDMVRKAIELQGGFEWVIDKGDVVMLKVNLVGGDSPSGEGENTDVRIVKALIKIIDEFTEGDVTIQVAEGTARSNDDPTKSGSVWDNSGYMDLNSDTYLSGIDFELFNLNQSIDDMVTVDLGDNGMSAIQGSSYTVHQAELDADVYIVVPVLKIHDTGMTNALKLQVGSAPGCWYGYNKMKSTSHSVGLYHDVDQRRWTSEMIVDLCAVADIDFVVIDAIMTLESYKSYSGNNQVRMNTIIACVDPVAADHVATRLFCLNPDDIAHITLAEKAGLGTNNPDQINIVGASIEDVRKKVDQNSSNEGKFGQSNRTWILSEAFNGTDVKEDHIADEANLRPGSGVNGWSEPMYFFDDRIDLLSYYGDKDMVSYAFSYFYSPEAKEAELWLSTHEGMEVFLNGAMIYDYYSTNASFDDDERGGDVGDIDLLEGENALLVKTSNKFGDYSFTLNICDHESSTSQKGNRVDGLKFYTKAGSVGVKENVIGEKTASLNVYPNPASDQVRISVGNSNETLASIKIYSINGTLLRVLKDNESISANEAVTWNLNDTNGNRVIPGIYLCTVESDHELKSARILVK